MKKLLLACALIAVASLSQAASLKWSMSNVKTAVPGEGNTFTNGDNATGYLVLLFATEQAGDYGKASTTLDAVVNALKDGKLSSDSAIASTLVSSGAIPTADQATGYNGNNYGADDSLSAFALVLNAGSIGDATAYFTTAEKSASWTSPSGAKTLAFASQANSSWTALQKTPAPVPEPATGALALAGVALLFKRRRA